jgi:two-component system sensor histidine kinase SenX3
VSVDHEALSRAVWNLLDNAVKYSGASREVEVKVTRAGNVVSIAVRDCGIGIAAAEQERIFEKFVRCTTESTTGIRGTGLGLAIVRHIVTAHGGTVNVSSATGEGSTFTIILPARR